MPFPTLPTRSEPRDSWHLPAMIIAWIAGGYLRAWQLGEQVIIGDEVHALKSAATGTLGSILQERGLPDVSIPMALWDYLLIQSIGLNEWGLRLPVFLPGVLFPVAAALFARRRIGPLAGVFTAWLAALTPALVMFSRFARPYMPIMFCSLVATVLWHRQLDGKRNRGWLAVLFSVIAISLSPSCGPALGILNAYGLVAVTCQNGIGVWDPRRVFGRGHLKSTLAFGLLAAVLCGGLAQVVRLLPEAHNLYLHAKWKGTPFDWPLILNYLSGTGSANVRMWMAISLLLGILCNVRRHITWMFLLMACVQVATILLFVPWGGRTFSVMRYLLVLYPLGALMIAAGLSAQAKALQSMMRVLCGPRKAILAVAGPALVIGFMTAYVGTGPLANIFQGTDSFTGFWPQSIQPPKAPLGRFYRFLGQSSHALTIVECPSISTAPASLEHYATYQARHGQRVVLLNRRAAYKQAGIEFQAIRPLKENVGVGMQGIDYIVVHLDFVEERKTLQASTLAVSQNPLQGTKTERELKKKAEQLVAEFDADPTLTPVLRNHRLAVYSPNPGAAEAYQAWIASHD